MRNHSCRPAFSNFVAKASVVITVLVVMQLTSPWQALAQTGQKVKPLPSSIPKKQSSAELRQTLWNNALQARNKGDYQKAVEFLNKLFQIERTELGMQHPDVIFSLKILAECYVAIDDMRQALRTGRMVAGASEAVYGRDDWRAAEYALAFEEISRVARLKNEEREQVREALQATLKAQTLKNQGDNKQAVETLQSSLAVLNRNFDKPLRAQAEQLFELGRLYIPLNDLAAEKATISLSLDAFQQVFSAEKFPAGHPSTKQTLQSLAYTLWISGERDASLDHFRAAAAMAQKLYPVEKFPNGHSDLADTLSLYGKMLGKAEKHETARAPLQAALEVYLKLTAANKNLATQVGLARCHQELGLAYWHTQMPDEAVEHCRESFAIFQAAYPEGHAEVVESAQTLGLLLKNTGEFDEAQEVLNKGVELARAVYPAEQFLNGHIEIIDTLGYLGEVQLEREAMVESKQAYLAALAMARKLYESAADDRTSETMAAILDQLSTIETLNGDFAASANYRRERVAMLRELYPEDNFPTGLEALATELKALAVDLEIVKEYEKSRAMAEEALVLFRRLYPADTHPQGHADIAACLAETASMTSRLLEDQAAVDAGQKALQAYRQLYPPTSHPQGHPDLADSLRSMGFYHQMVDQFAAAQQLYEEAASMLLQLMGEDQDTTYDWKLLDTYQSLSTVCWFQSLLDEAERYAELAVDTSRSLYSAEKYPLGHEEILESMATLANVYLQQDRFMEARQIREEMLAVGKRLYPVDEHPNGHDMIANTLASIGSVCRDQEDFTAAKEYGETAVAMYRRLVTQPDSGVDDNALPGAIKELGDTNLALEQYDICETLFREALSLYQQIYPVNLYPDGHADIAATINDLARMYERQRDFPTARDMYTETLDAYRHLYPPETYPNGHLLLASAHGSLGYILKKLGQYPEASHEYEIQLAMFRQLYPVEKYPHGTKDLASCLTSFGFLQIAQGDHKQARESHQEALTINKALFPREKYPDGHRDILMALNTLGGTLRDQGALSEAEELLTESLAMSQQMYPAETYPHGHLDIANSLNSLAYMYSRQRDFQQARKYSQESLEMLRTLYPAGSHPDGHPEIADQLHSVAYLLDELGDYAVAHTYYSESLEMRKRLFADHEDGHPDIAQSLNSLGAVSQTLGNYHAAFDYYDQSLEMRQKLYPPTEYPDGNMQIVTCLNNLGNVSSQLFRSEDALAYYQRSLAMRRTLAKTDSSSSALEDLALGLNNLGFELRYNDRFSEAREHYEEALSIYQELYPEEEFPQGHPSLALTMGNLGGLMRQLGEYEAAVGMLEDSLKMRQALFPPEQYPQGHPDLALAHQALGFLYPIVGKPKEALQNLNASFRIEQAILQNVLLSASEETMHSYLKTVDATLDGLLSLALRYGDQLPNAKQLAWNAVLQRKTVIFDATSTLREMQRLQKADPEFAARLNETATARQKLAELSLDASGDEAPKNRLLRESLTERIEELATLTNQSLRSSLLDDTQEPLSVEKLKSQLPPDAAYLEFVRVDPYQFDAEPGALNWQPERYVALAVTGQENSTIHMVDLGPIEDIETDLGAMREQIVETAPQLSFYSEEGLEEKYREVSHVVYSKVIAPIRGAIGKANLVYVAPDGALNSVSFEALVDDDDHYLVENHKFAYLSSGHDLLREFSQKNTGTIVFANPDYNLSGQRQQEVSELLLAQLDPVDPNLQGEALRSIDLRGLSWVPLPATLEEAKRIEKLFENHGEWGPVEMYLGEQALESAFKHISAPGILHLATHGYYLPDQKMKQENPLFSGSQAQVEVERTQGSSGSSAMITAAQRTAILSEVENPLLRSGIVLAGANKLDDSSGKQEDGWVTAEEIAISLDLTGTHLVVLSACETGLGDVRNGEGVSGLRRAFLQAGARTLVTSLYKVPETATKELMQVFYERLATDTTTLDAFHEAQKEIIRRRREENNAAHPFFWGSFILVGNPG